MNYNIGFNPTINPYAYNIGQNYGTTNTNNTGSIFNNPALNNTDNGASTCFTNALIEVFKQETPQKLSTLEAQINSLAQVGDISQLTAGLKALKEKCNQALNGAPTKETIDYLNKEIEAMQTSISNITAQASQTQATQEQGAATGTIDPTALDAYCKDIESYISGGGTKEDELKAKLQLLNGNNVVEIIKHWEDTKGKHSDNEGMIARILKDLNDGEQKEMVPLILNALVQKADSLGLSAEITENVNKINKELEYERGICNFWCGGQNDDEIKNNLMAIYDKIMAKGYQA